MSYMIKYANFILVFTPFLFPYFLPGTTINLQFVFILFNSIIFWYYNKKHHIHIYWPKFLKSFTLYTLFVPIIGYLFYRNFGVIKSTYISYFPFLLCLLQIQPLIRWEILKKYFKGLVYVSIAFFFIQEIMYYILGWRVMGLLPFMPVSYSYTTMSDFISKMSQIDRSMSFFLEPAHYAQYLLGYLALVLSENIKLKKFFSKDSIVVSTTLLLTWSGNAILLMTILWILFILKCHMRPLIKYVFFIPSIIIICVISFNILSTTEKGENLLDRQKELSTDQSRLSSGMIRVYRGYFVYEGMPFVQKLIGVGTGSAPEVIEHSKYFFMFYDFDRYLNTAQIILIGYGCIGGILFLLFLFKLLKKKNPFPLFFIVLFIGLSLMEGFWMSGRMLLYLSIAIYTSRYYKNINYLIYEENNACFRNTSRSY